MSERVSVQMKYIEGKHTNGNFDLVDFGGFSRPSRKYLEWQELLGMRVDGHNLAINDETGDGKTLHALLYSAADIRVRFGHILEIPRKYRNFVVVVVDLTA